MRKLTITLMLLGAFALSGCRGLSSAGEASVRDAIAANAGHMKDEGLPSQARSIATVNHDALWQLLYHEGEEDALPAEVKARQDARKAAAGGGQ